MLKKLLILSAIFLFSTSVEAKTYRGNHTFYFDMPNGKAVEVYFEGEYKFDYQARRYKPSKGNYTFDYGCQSQYSCNTKNEAEKVMMGFQDAIKNSSFYTIEFERPPEECLPGEVCQQPFDNKPLSMDNNLEHSTQSRGTTRRTPAETETTVTQTVKDLVEIANGISDIFKAWWKSDDNATIIIRGKDGHFKSACQLKKTVGPVKECEEVTEAKVENNTIKGEYEYIETELEDLRMYQSIRNWFIHNYPGRCSTTMTCVPRADGSSLCTVVYSCNF